MITGVNSNPPKLHCDINFDYNPKTVQGAARILRHAFLGNKDLYNAFLASIASVLKELPKETGLYDVAKAVADRIIGEE